MEHPKEQEAVELGENLFNRRMGPFDFACTTCHADSGKRIRLQPLPFLAKARRSTGRSSANGRRIACPRTHVMTMQHRVLDCFWQMRMHRVEMGSETTNALIAYMVKTAQGGDIGAPGMKR